jgi:S-adenosylmethionine:tRNA ribosyltransferase-isomerase
MLTSDLDYILPPSLIARHPAHPRDRSRLMVYRRGANSLEHRIFSDLADKLEPGDLLVLNDTRVLPAKLRLRRNSGGLVNGLFLNEISPGQWRVMLQSRGRCAVGSILEAPNTAGKANSITFTLTERLPEKGQWTTRLNTNEPATLVLEKIGAIPLPPYIQKARKTSDSGAGDDNLDYQTIYAKSTGAVAAPTAGLHFTPAVFNALKRRGVKHTFLTLHVGLGTFLPVETARLEDHPIHEEWFTIPQSTVKAVREQRVRGGRIVAVGTTSVRALESAAEQLLDEKKEAGGISARTNLLIKPVYQWRVTDVLITNFHLPRSTLLALVAALVGLEKLKELYQTAIEEKYRFYSYGDAMLILP